MDKLKIEYLSVDDLTPYENNTRRHVDYDVDQIATSIEKYGFDDPIGIWGEDNTIVEGHGRLEAAKQLGLEEVPIIRLDHLNDEQRKEYAIMHNKTAELSNWDFSMLEKELEGLNLDDFDVDFGISKDEITNDYNTGDEIDLDDFDDDKYEHTCPKCGFKFND